ncbi:O-antigen ligase family protein, partial [Streptomyces sp. NPDC001941]|uniref:O-antigen ligase family protein n=1 Tax=Streptomyces sp. NPDC001941 TaxID=3154659 RepID=UPI0033269901
GLLVLAAGAACCAASAARRPAVRAALWLLAAGVAGAALARGSAAGFAASLGVLLCSPATARVRRRVPALTALALVTVLLGGASWALAEGVLPDGLSASLAGPLTGHRILLWRDALDLVEAHPLLGAGPDRFGELSATAQQALHADGKPHSAVFQLAAEQGVVGVALLALAFGWLLFGLARSPRPTPVVLTAAAALTALAGLASVGNVLSFTPVTAGAGLLAGLATAGPARAEAPDDEALPDGGGHKGRGVAGAPFTPAPGSPSRPA